MLGKQLHESEAGPVGGAPADVDATVQAEPVVLPPALLREVEECLVPPTSPPAPHHQRHTTASTP